MNSEPTGLEIAVIGMACKFPGSDNITGFWELLKNGREAVSFFSDEELLEAGVDPNIINNPDYVKGKAVIRDADHFDAHFFDYTPGEAALLDPQIRLFYHTAWETLEDAGYNPHAYKGLIGVYAGASSTFLWESMTLLTGAGKDVNAFTASQLKNKDFMSTHMAYKLNLKGPALMVHSACSTSLAAIHLACRALLTGECHMALAGGATISLPPVSGYLYEKGMITSPDGHCRPYDANSLGTVEGDGVGLVLLKPLESALADGDSIYAVVKSSALNNDGARKVGFSSPSVEGQAESIRMALEFGQVEPESISFIETHGTGTELGDPVEVEALKLTYGSQRKNACAIGSVKSNFGHLDCAAGVAGFIKAVLAVKNKQIPATIHFRSPNPRLDLENSPFYVNNKLEKWQDQTGPLRGAVSSFGVGGTNAHVILEEAPGLPEPESHSPSPLVFPISAKTPGALSRNMDKLAAHIEADPGVHLPGMAYTLQVGRNAFPYRRMSVCSTSGELTNALASNPGKYDSVVHAGEKRPVIFMFSGQGSQYMNMGRELYEKIPFFKDQMDTCFGILRNVMGEDVKSVVYPSEPEIESGKADKEKINQFLYTSPIKFAFEYSLARLMMHWGIQPHAMVGHSFGEYVAACLAGVFSLEDGLTMAALRGRLMHQVDEGAMMSVPLPEEELEPMLDEELDMAAVNGPGLCIVSGPVPAVKRFEEQLLQNGHECVILRVPRAGHSRMMIPIMDTFKQGVSRIKLDKPQIPYISGVTGQWINVKDAADPGYYARHLRHTVRFGDALGELLKTKNAVFLQLGSDRSLTSFVTLNPAYESHHRVLNLVRHPKDEISDQYFLMDKIGQLWLYGCEPDWNRLYGEQPPHRLHLPTYSFDSRPYGVMGDPVVWARKTLGSGQLMVKTDPADWFYLPTWKRADNPSLPPKPTAGENWLIFTGSDGLGSELIQRLESLEQNVVTVTAGNEFQKTGESQFSIDPGKSKDYLRLWNELTASGRTPRRIIHLWNVSSGSGEPGAAVENGFYSLFYLAGALDEAGAVDEIDIEVVSNGMHEVTGGDLSNPEKAVLLGPVKVIPLEYPHIRCRSIDIQVNGTAGFPTETLAVQLIDEFLFDSGSRVVAFRGNHRWEQDYKAVRLDMNPGTPLPLKEKGVYLITGGLGGIGLVLARHLAETYRAGLILLGRSGVPSRENWEKESSSDNRLTELLEIEKSASGVLALSADVSNPDQMETVIRQAMERFGRIDGVIHAAGVPDGAAIGRRTNEMNDAILAPKVQGTLVLDRVLKDAQLDFTLYCSSGNAIAPVFGQLAHCAANAFLDAYAVYKTCAGHSRTLSVNWDAWSEVGQAAESLKEDGTAGSGLTNKEGIDAFRRTLATISPQVIVSKLDFGLMMEQYGKPMQADAEEEQDIQVDTLPDDLPDRPVLGSEYEAPGNPTEEKLVGIWQRFFGYREIGVRDDFFQLGGDSLKGTIITSKIYKQLNVKIPVAEIFSRSTIAELAAFIDEQGQRSEYIPIPRVEPQDFYPLSSAQKRLYILQQMDLESVTYNMPQVTVINRPLDKDKVKEIFMILLQRHEALSTAFQLVEGEVKQIIVEEAELEYKYEDISQTGADELQSVIAGKVRQFVKPFDLSRAPLMRAGLLKIDAEKYLLLMDMHHIIADGASITLLEDEFKRLYAGQDLPGLKLQYRDYAAWINDETQQRAIKKQEQFWLREFSGTIPVLSLSYDFPRPEIQQTEGDEKAFLLDKQLTAKIKKISQEGNVTLFMVLLTFFNILLSKLSGQEDIVIGIPIAGRRHPDLENIVGMFVNTLALRNYPGAEKPFNEFLAEVGEKTLQAFENQEYQFEDLVEHVVEERDMSRNPLFDVAFLLRTEEGDIRDSEEEIDPNLYVQSVSEFDLRLTVVERGAELFCIFSYCVHLFKPETIDLYIRYFKELVSQVTGDKTMRLKDIQLSHQLIDASPDIADEEGDFGF